MRARLLIVLAAAVLAAAWLPAERAAAQISILGLKNSMVQFLLEQISVPGEFEVTAEAVEEPEDGVTSLVGVTVSDGQGVWLRIGEARLNWSPLRLLRGEIEIGELGATDVELLRLPVTPPATEPETPEEDASDDPFAWPRAPLALHVRDIALQRVSIAPGLFAEQGLAFDATGAARDEGDFQSARLSLRRTDQVAGRIQLEYLRRFETPSLLIALTAQEAPGGLVAELAGLPASSASRVNLRAEGPFDAWQVRLSAEADRILSVTGLLTIDAQDSLSAVASLTATPGPELDPALAAALEPRARLAFRASEGEGGLVTIEEGAFTSAGLSAEAAGSWNRDTAALQLDLSAALGPQLAALAEGVAWEAIAFDGAVNGPLDALEAEGGLQVTALEAPSVLIGSGRLDLAASVSPGAVEARLTGRLDEVTADKLTPDVLGAIELAVEAALEDQTARLASLTLTTGIAVLEASGTADLGASEAAIAYALDAPDLGPVARAYDVPVAAALRADGEARGPFDALAVVGRLALEELAYAGRELGVVSLDHDIVASAGVAGEISLAAEGEDYGRATIDAAFDAGPERIELASLEADLLGAVIDGEAVVDLAGPFADGSFVISAPDLSTLDPLLQPLTGERLTGAVAGDVALAAADGRQNAQARLSIEGFSGFEATLDSAEVDADIADLLGAPAGEAAIKVLRLAHPSASLEDAAIEVTAASPDGRTDVDAVFALTGIGAPGDLRIERVAGDASARDVLGVPDAAMEATLQGLTSETASVAEAALSFEGAALTSDAPSGALTLRATGMTAAGAEAPEAVVEASLTPEGRAEALVDLPSAVGEGLRVAALRLDAAADDALGEDPAIDVKIGVDRLEAGGAVLSGVEASALGQLSALDIAARAGGSVAVGDDPQPLDFETAARLDLAGEGPQGEVSRLRAALGPAVVQLREALRISSAEGVTRLENVALDVPGGTLDALAAIHPDGVEAELDADLSRFAQLRDTAEAFGAALPLASADIDLSLQADTRPASASAAGQLRARDLRIVQTDDGVDSDEEALQPLSLDADLDWDGARAALQAALAGPFGQPVRVEASAPVTAGEGGTPALQPNGPIAGRVLWRGDIANFWTYVPAPDHVLSGTLDIDLGVAGTAAAPQITGDVALNGGQYQNLETGTILTALTLTSSLDSDGGLLLDVSARDGAQGSLAAEIDFGAGDLTARLTAAEAVLIRRDDVTAAISADITAAGPIAAPAINGVVTVDRAEVSLLGSLPPSVASLGEVTFAGDPEPEPPGESGPQIPIDLRVEGPGDIFVRGRGLDSEWRINLQVLGTAAAPRITGEVERVRGRLDFLGRNFELERGAVRFTGGTDIDPLLDISLEHDRDGFIGRIELSGNASAPEVGFSSSPAVPESEVLPRTIFGKDTQSLGPGDALLLANGVATLTGTGGDGSVRNALGLDVLRLDESADGTAEVSVGANVADGVFVGVNTPVDGSPSTVEVEVEVYPSLSVRAETGSEEGETLGVKWRIDW